jgi:hypothetical protein
MEFVQPSLRQEIVSTWRLPITAPKTDRLKQVPSWEFRNRRKSFTPRQFTFVGLTPICVKNSDLSPAPQRPTAGRLQEIDQLLEVDPIADIQEAVDPVEVHMFTACAGSLGAFAPPSIPPACVCG